MTEDTPPGLPSPEAVPAWAHERANALKIQFLKQWPSSDPRVAEYCEEYHHWFQRDVLSSAPPDRLKYFANSNFGASAGNMSPFNIEWNKLGAEEAAARVRGAVEYLLYGPEGTALHNRLTDLINGTNQLGMKGFREALLTKVLCMAEPQAFLPILVYAGKEGKRHYAKRVYDLELPSLESVSWTIGRLIIWSNDLLLSLVGEGFDDTWHSAQFLYNAVEQIPGE